MSVPYVTFRPAEYRKGKESYIFFYALNPVSNKLERKRIKVNHVGNSATRDRYAKILCHQINEKLFSGWNPFIEKMQAKGVTISAAIDRFIAAKSKSSREKTISSYKSFVKTFKTWIDENNFGDRFCVLFDRLMIVQYMEWVDNTKELSNRSYNNYVDFMVTLFDFFVMKGWIKKNPVVGIESRKVDKKTRTTISKEDRAKIKSYFQSRIPNYYYTMQLCYRLFIRPLEISKIRISYIDTENGFLRIPSDVAKNHNERVLALPDELLEYFRRISDLPGEWYVFSDHNTYAPGAKYMAPTRYAERWNEMRTELNLPKSYQFYSLKDTGITEMLEAGVPAKFVKELADHHSLEMTEKYIHKSSAKKILEWNKLEF